MRSFSRVLFTSFLIASLFSWLYFSYVRASRREAILIEDRYADFKKDAIIYPGHFKFLWQRILPGRITLHPVRLFPRSFQLHFKQGLEKSDTLGLDDSFYIRALLFLDYKLIPENMIGLFQRLGALGWKNLEPYLKLRMQNFLENRVRTLYKDDKDLAGLKGRLRKYFQAKAQGEINREFAKDGVYVRSLITQKVFVPDPVHYQALIASAQKLIDQKIRKIGILDTARAKRDAARITREEYFARMQGIGELLKNYPHLRNYLVVDRLSDNIQVLVMPYQDLLSSSLLSDSINQKRQKGKLPPKSRNLRKDPGNETEAQKALDSALPSSPSASRLPTPPQDSESGSFADLSPP